MKTTWLHVILFYRSTERPVTLIVIDSEFRISQRSVDWKKQFPWSVHIVEEKKSDRRQRLMKKMMIVSAAMIIINGVMIMVPSARFS